MHLLDQGNDISITGQHSEVAQGNAAASKYEIVVKSEILRKKEFQKKRHILKSKVIQENGALVCVSQSVNKEHNLILCIVYWQF